MATNPVPKISEEEYLALDRAAQVRSEYVDGEIFAMSGGSLAHGWIQSNLLGELHALLRGTGCKAFASDTRVQVAGRAYLYPDISIICGTPVLTDALKDILTNPVAVFEILSPSTEQYDRGPKFQYYRSIPSLREYILIDQNRVFIEQFTRADSGLWTLRDFQKIDDQMRIDSIGVSIPLSRVYDSVEFSAVDPAQ